MSENIYVEITENEIDINKLYNFCKDERSGAINCFGGTTRNYFENNTVLKLSYECYYELALKSLNRIASDLLKKGAYKVALVHRIGDVPVTETSVFCVVSTGHRNESFTLCKEAIDILKTDVEIWKKEIYDNNVHIWKENNK